MNGAGACAWRGRAADIEAQAVSELRFMYGRQYSSSLSSPSSSSSSSCVGRSMLSSTSAIRNSTNLRRERITACRMAPAVRLLTDDSGHFFGGLFRGKLRVVDAEPQHRVIGVAGVLFELRECGPGSLEQIVSPACDEVSSNRLRAGSSTAGSTIGRFATGAFSCAGNGR